MENKITIKKVQPKSLGKILGAIYGLFGLIFGFVFTVVMIMGTMFAPVQAGPLGMSSVFTGFMGIFFIIFIPLIYAVIGFIGGIITAWLYNLVSKKIGGLEVEINREEDNKQA